MTSPQEIMELLRQNLYFIHPSSLFQKRFKRILLKDEFRWRYILAYIHHNPIHHNYQKEYKDWKFSSYLAFLSNHTTLISRKQVLKRFDENLEEARKKFVVYHENVKKRKTWMTLAWSDSAFCGLLLLRHPLPRSS